jgi:hypothetical protein
MWGKGSQTERGRGTPRGTQQKVLGGAAAAEAEAARLTLRHAIASQVALHKPSRGAQRKR